MFDNYRGKNVELYMKTGIFICGVLLDVDNDFIKLQLKNTSSGLFKSKINGSIEIFNKRHIISIRVED